PNGHLRRRRELRDDLGPCGLLQDDHVGGALFDHGSDGAHPPHPAVTDVVGQQAQGHGVSSLPQRVRYGWPMTCSRRYMTQSRVPWMLTGRPTIFINRSRRGRRPGAMSGSFSLTGREWILGMKKPSS